MARDFKYRHFHCSECGRLTSKPWDAVWCLHHDSTFSPHPPSSPESDWTRMAPVTKVKTAELPDVPWLVVEQRNTINLPADQRTWDRRIVSGPMSMERAMSYAAELEAGLSEPSHMHGFDAWPEDLISKRTRKAAAKYPPENLPAPSETQPAT